MASLDDFELLPPKNWEKFEDLLWELHKRLWDDPDAQKVGRPGQSQDGIDIFGHPNRGIELAGVQVRRRKGRLTTNELRSAVEEAKKFQPPLDSFTYAMSEPNDTKTQQMALTLSRENRAAGSFSVTAMGWNEIERRLKPHADLVERYYGGLFPATKKEEPPRLVLRFRNDGVQPGRNAPERVISLFVDNVGGGIVSEFTFQMQIPFLPPLISEPIAPDRVIRPMAGTARDGKVWKNWWHWQEHRDDGTVMLGITFQSFGDVKAYRPLELMLCQFKFPEAWFSPTPRPTTYQCKYVLVYPPDHHEEGVLPLELFELVKGCY